MNNSAVLKVLLESYRDRVLTFKTAVWEIWDALSKHYD